MLSKSPIKWRQRPDMTIAVDWDVKHQFKQTIHISQDHCHSITVESLTLHIPQRLICFGLNIKKIIMKLCAFSNGNDSLGN